MKINIYLHTKITIKNNVILTTTSYNSTMTIIILTSIATYKNIHRLRMRYKSNIYTYISYVLYIIMLARQSGERCFQSSHNSFWTFLHTPLTVNLHGYCL